MKEETVQYRYRPKPLKVLLGIIFFGTTSFLAADAALGNERSGNVAGIALDVTQTATLLWGAFLMTAVLSALGLFLLYRAYGPALFVAIGPESIAVPRLFKGGSSVICYASIKNWRLDESLGQFSFRLFHANGTNIISSTCLDSKADFQDIVNLVLERLEPISDNV